MTRYALSLGVGRDPGVSASKVVEVMLYFSPLKAWMLLAAVVLSVLFAVPNVLPTSWRNALPLPTGPVVLGLDLQGGSHVLLEVDRKDLHDKKIRQLLGEVRQILRESRIKYGALSPRRDGVSFRLIDPGQKSLALEKLREFSKKSALSSGLSSLVSAGGNNGAFQITEEGDFLVLGLSSSEEAARLHRAVEQSLEIINRRINALGTTEPIIQRQGEGRILVQIPGLQDPARVKALLGKTAQLTFQLLCSSQPTETRKRPPFDCEEVTQPDEPGRVYWVATGSQSTVDGADLNNAWPEFDGQTGQHVVQFHFNQRGALKFAQLTKSHVGQPFAIVLDREVVSAPVIQEPILSGSGRITGNFSQQGASDLSIVLRSGALPAKLTIVEERTVGPSLGADSIRAGIVACTVGVLGVFLFMIVCYGLFGFFAVLALGVNLIALVGVLSLLGATLTLPGIAGIVLTMGVAVDSNVLIYERIREEMKRGRSVVSALETGFKMAFSTIFDANVTSLIAAIVLFGVGSGPVRGFAVTLTIGILTTIFTAFTLTRFLISLWVRWGKPKAIPL